MSIEVEILQEMEIKLMQKIAVKRNLLFEMELSKVARGDIDAVNACKAEKCPKKCLKILEDWSFERDLIMRKEELRMKERSNPKAMEELVHMESRLSNIRTKIHFAIKRNRNNDT